MPGPADLDEFIAGIANQAGADPDNTYARDSEFAQADVRMAWRGIDFTALDQRAARALHGAAGALLPILQRAKTPR